MRKRAQDVGPVGLFLLFQGAIGKLLGQKQRSFIVAPMEIEILDFEFQGHPETIASFLLHGSGGSVLIETGPESCRDSLLGLLEERKIAPDSLAGVFVTHVHLDHAGAAGWFASRGVPVHVHPRGARHLVDPEKLVASARQVYGDAFERLWGDMTPAPEESVRVVVEEEKIEIAGLTIRVVETPGHAFHHHSFQVGDALFAGDAAGARLDESGYLSVTSAPPQFDLEHSLASLEKLEKLECRRLFLTHFGEVPDPASHWTDYREAVELNVHFVKQRLDEGMDEGSLRVAYQAFQMEQAFRARTPIETWNRMQAINGTDMCADGIRMYWQRKLEEDRS